MDKLLTKIMDANALGYRVEFHHVLNQNYITCEKEGNSRSTVIPDDHVNDKTIIDIIQFNIAIINDYDKLFKNAKKI
jgi:hypothetical protein